MEKHLMQASPQAHPCHHFSPSWHLSLKGNQEHGIPSKNLCGSVGTTVPVYKAHGLMKITFILD